MKLTETLRELEQSLLDSSTRKNSQFVSSLLADDFREFGCSGRIYSKAEIIAALQAESETRISMREFEARSLAGDTALVTYISTKLESGKAPNEALRSSIWALRGGQWRIVFHQGTMLPRAET